CHFVNDHANGAKVGLVYADFVLAVVSRGRVEIEMAQTLRIVVLVSVAHEFEPAGAKRPLKSNAECRATAMAVAPRVDAILGGGLVPGLVGRQKLEAFVRRIVIDIDDPGDQEPAHLIYRET